MLSLPHATCHQTRIGLGTLIFLFLLPGQYMPILVQKCSSFEVYAIVITLFLTQLLHMTHTLAHHSYVQMDHTPCALAFKFKKKLLLYYNCPNFPPLSSSVQSTPSSRFLNLLITFASTSAACSLRGSTPPPPAGLGRHR